MPKMRLKKGKHYGSRDANGVVPRYEVGELVDLSESAVLAFADKFEAPEIQEAQIAGAKAVHEAKLKEEAAARDARAPKKTPASMER